MSTTYNHIISDETGQQLHADLGSLHADGGNIHADLGTTIHADLQAIVAMGTTRYDEAISTAEAAVETADAVAALEEYDRQQANGTYAGRDLATVLASETASAGSIYAALHARAQAGDYDGLRIRDWVDVTLRNSTVMRYRIAALDHYRNCGDTAMGHHIHMVPDTVYNEAVRWNSTNTNQGTASEKNPYLASNLHAWEVGTFLPLLPDALQAVLVEPRALMEERYNASSQLTASTGWSWKGLGKVFSLDEVEVCGQVVWGTPGWSAGMSSQLPIFQGAGDRIKGRLNWHLRVAHGSSATKVCYVGSSGYVRSDDATVTWPRPLPCFLIG